MFVKQTNSLFNIKLLLADILWKSQVFWTQGLENIQNLRRNQLESVILRGNQGRNTLNEIQWEWMMWILRRLLSYLPSSDCH